jgi:hypothetical protein
MASPPVFSSPVTPRWNKGPWASSPSFAPRSYPRRTSERRQAVRTGLSTTPPASAEPPIGASHFTHAPSRRT